MKKNFSFINNLISIFVTFEFFSGEDKYKLMVVLDLSKNGKLLFLN